MKFSEFHNIIVMFALLSIIIVSTVTLREIRQIEPGTISVQIVQENFELRQQLRQANQFISNLIHENAQLKRRLQKNNTMFIRT